MARTSDFICAECGKIFETERQLHVDTVIVTHKSECGLCQKNKLVKHIRHYNYLRI